jgi:two-component system chemotaxis response regulator CheB
MIRVLLVDDSAVIRGFLRKVIESGSGMEICGVAENGEQAVQFYRDLSPDIVVMDVEMPEMDGLTALRHILEINPGARVIMCSSLTKAGGDVTMKALQIGAIDYLLKPSNDGGSNSPAAFSQSLLEKVAAVADGGKAKPSRPEKTDVGAPVVPVDNITTRPVPPAFRKADIIAIGSSTGGVQALFTVLESLARQRLTVPVVITQHMPATFTRILAAHIQEKTGIETVEAEQGMAVENGRIYIAPGGYHMEITRDETKALRVHLSDAPPENFCRPSVDPMLRSLLTANVGRVLTVILTGMGSDGFTASQTLVEKGHVLVAQDQETSIVWGMPGAVAMAGLCNAVLPLDKIATYLEQYL